MTSRIRISWWWLVPVVLVMFWLGARGLDVDPLWNDEWYMLRDARSHNDPIAIMLHVAGQNPWHAPSYFVLMNWWGRLIEWNPFGTRALALFFGVLAVAWTYRLGRDFFSRRIGLIAALLVASSEFFVHYLSESRMYTLTVMLTAASVWLYLRVMTMKPELRLRDYALVFLTAFFMLHTHYFLGLLLAGIGLYHLLFMPKNRRWWGITSGTVLAGLLFLPWFSAFLRGFNQAASRSVEAYVSGPQVVVWVGYLFSNGYTLFLIVALVLAAFALMRSRGSLRQSLGLTLFSILLIAIAVTVVSLVLEVFGPSRARYMIFIWPLLALAAAAGILELGRLISRQRLALITGLIVALWVGVGVWQSLYPNITADLPGNTLTYPLHTVMRTLHPLHVPGDYIVNVVSDTDELRRYSNIQEFYLMGERMAADSGAIGLVSEEPQAELYQDVMSQIGSGRSYVWVGYRDDPVPTPLEPFEQVLQAEYAYCGVAATRPDWHLQIDEFARSPVCCHPNTANRPPLIDYGNGLQLVGIDLTPAENGLQAWVSWQGGSLMPSGQYSVGLHVLDAEGNLAAQTDYGLPNTDFLCEQKPMNLGSLPAGDYELVAIVYDWQTGARLPGALVSSGEQGDSLLISRFTVAEDGTLMLTS